MRIFFSIIIFILAHSCYASPMSFSQLPIPNCTGMQCENEGQKEYSFIIDIENHQKLCRGDTQANLSEITPIYCEPNATNIRVVYSQNYQKDSMVTDKSIFMPSNEESKLDREEYKTLEEITLRPGDSNNILPANILVFKQAETKKLQIINGWQDDISIEGVYFIVNKLTAVSVLKGLAISGLNPGEIIAGNGRKELQIQAKDDAASSIYPEGTQLIISYKVKGKAKQVSLKVKVSYHEDIGFYERNLTIKKATVCDRPCDPSTRQQREEQCNYTPAYSYSRENLSSDRFKCDDQGSCVDRCFALQEKKLVIRNKNNKAKITIKEVGLLDFEATNNLSAPKLTNKSRGIQIKQGNCKELVGAGEVCEVAIISVNQEATDFLTPIFIKYDLEGENGAKDLIATAVIVNENQRNKSDITKTQAAAEEENIFAAILKQSFAKLAKNDKAEHEIDVNQSLSLGMARDALRKGINAINMPLVDYVVAKVTGPANAREGLGYLLEPYVVGCVYKRFIKPTFPEPEKKFCKYIYKIGGKSKCRQRA